MFNTTNQHHQHHQHNQHSRPRGHRIGLALAGTATLASVVLAAGPAQARVETPQDTGGRVAQSDIGPTRVAGLYGVHVDGGWLLR